MYDAGIRTYQPLGATTMPSHPPASVTIYLRLQQGLPTAMKTVLIRPSHPALVDTTIGGWTCSGTALETYHLERFSVKTGPRQLIEAQALLDKIALEAYQEVLYAWQQIHLTYELLNTNASRQDPGITPPDDQTELPAIFDVVWDACTELEQVTLARIAQFGQRASAPPPPS